MRIRIFLYLSILLLTSCDTGGPLWSNGVDWETHFSPPEWIQGEWEVENRDYESQSYVGFKFTTHDFYYKVASYVAHSCSGDIWSGIAIKGNDKTSATTYQVNIDYNGHDDYYEFTFVSPTEIHGTYRRVPYTKQEVEYYILFKK